MCYQKFHTCKYCNQPYPCDLDNYTCPTLNHDINMEMCLACEKKLEDKLDEVDIEKINLFDIDLSEFLKENE